MLFQDGCSDFNKPKTLAAIGEAIEEPSQEAYPLHVVLRIFSPGEAKSTDS